MATAIQKALGTEDQNILGKYRPLTAPSAGALSTPTAAPSMGSDLSKFGYTGPLGLNDYEQEYLKKIAAVSGDTSAMDALNSSRAYYDKVLGGEFGPESEAYISQVLDPLRANAMSSYNDLAKALATKYSSFGGYYGGRSGIAQGKLAAQTANDMAAQEAQLRYQRFADNLNAMDAAAGGLRGLSGDIVGLQNNTLAQLLGGGNLITGREEYNQDQYQAALDRSYQDWTRARAEQLLPYQLAQALLGTGAVENVVTQDPGLLATILSPFAMVGGAVAANKIVK